MSDAYSISGSDWVKGISFSILASTIGACSKLAIRKSWLIEMDSDRDQNREEDEETHSLTVSKYLKPKMLRYSGMVGMSVLNPICCVAAMNYASPSILAPFSGLTLVWVILFSGITVGERPSKTEIFSAILIMCGEIIVAIFGDHTTDNGKTVEDVVSF